MDIQTENMIRMWRAVVSQVLKDYKTGTRAVKKEAAKWLFRDTSDYLEVMALAQLNPKEFRDELLSMREENEI